MGHKYAELAFTDSVRQVQQELGSRAGYQFMDEGEDVNYVLSENESNFIEARDSFYMASVSETGWPYLQHRGGPQGFVRVIDAQTIGFADFIGNRQYVSVGNLRKDNRVSLFFMDYPNRTRLKVLGRVELIDEEDSAKLAALEVDDYRARVERGFVIHIEAFDWNCPQHITPRYTDAHVESLLMPLVEENKALKSARSQDTLNKPEVIGQGPLDMVISGVRQLTPRIRAFELRDVGGNDLPEFEAGAHLEIPYIDENDITDIRHYSICSNPARRDIYEIAVLRDEDGEGGSQIIHQSFGIGTRISTALPINHFSLHSDSRPAVLIAGGIGITPIKPMAQVLLSRGAPMDIHYAAASPVDMAFRDRLQREFGSTLSAYYSSEDEHINIDSILSNADDDAVIYVCGPGRLIDSVVSAAESLNIDADRIRFERFNVAANLDAKPVQLELRKSGMQIDVPGDKTLLDAILEAGVNVPFSCQMGNCRSCATKLLEGEADHRDAALSVSDREVGRLFCPCVSRAKSDRLVLDL